jgi:hypothetical protein
MMGGTADYPPVCSCCPAPRPVSLVEEGKIRAQLFDLGNDTIKDLLDALAESGEFLPRA